MAKLVKNLIGFFPIQLLVLQFKSNYLSLIFWGILFAIISKKFFLGFGVPFLFLSPEYLSEVSLWSYAIIGFSLGGFIMAFNTYSYVMLGRSFPFLAALKRPFLKFSMNNSVIPLVFVVFFTINIGIYTMTDGMGEFMDLILNLAGFIIGLVLFLVISAYYFFKTNKSLDLVQSKKERSLITSWVPVFQRSKPRKYFPKTYFDKGFKISICRDTSHYSQVQLNNVYSQNHVNAILFEALIIISFLGIGMLQDYRYFSIPAGASIILLFTISQMVISAFYNWFKGWATLVIILVFIGLNQFSSNFEFFQFKSQAIGLDYEAEKANYKKLSLENKDLSQAVFDLYNQEELLDNWKEKTQEDKPKLIILNSSGGGIRSAYWNFLILQKLHKETKGKSTNNIQMITGASGGMIGSAFFREISQRYSNDEIGDEKFLDSASADLLNMVAASMVTNDLFLKFRRGDYDDQSYIKDRGFAFEENLVKNYGPGFNKGIGEYSEDEKSAKIPQMIFVPTIIEDGRRMLISSQPLGFLTKDNAFGVSENVEYMKLLKNNNAKNTRLASVLRMNATFPYIMPMVTLPTVPETTIMDAGLRDNYGGKLTMEYVLQLKKWIRENTSGVVVVQVRDLKKVGMREENLKNSIADRLVKPLGNMFQNLFKTQDYDQQEMYRMVSDDLNFPLHIVSFNLLDEEGDMSLSWRLTEMEKKNVMTSFKKSTNQSEFRKLVNLIQD